jgi:hypothetical protein
MSFRRNGMTEKRFLATLEMTYYAILNQVLDKTGSGF